MAYIAQIIAFLLALLGAFYKNTQKKDGDYPVYWRGFPVLTPLGRVLLVAIVASAGLAVYSVYDQGKTKDKEKAEQQNRADRLQLTLDELNSRSTETLKNQIDRFKAILDNQDRVGNNTINRISNASTDLKNNIEGSSEVLSTNIVDTSKLLRGSITETSSLLRTNVLEAALAGRKSIPTIYWSVKKGGVVHDFGAFMKEKEDAESTDLGIKTRSIGFIPKSVRDVIFPFSNNMPLNNSGVAGVISFRIGEFNDAHVVGLSGFVERDISINFSSIRTMITNINGSESDERDLFALQFKFDKEWSWEEMNEALKNKYRQDLPVIRTERWHVPDPPPQPPSFQSITFIAILSEHPTFRIFMPLISKNYKYDRIHKQYSYELHISKPPEIITEYSYYFRGK